ncbi:MAG TPA: DUF47 family protein [Candidatus Lokiarchaeia archaeon]|nr:DUF47 family protein [Candidatus Lokiarchaeia archaeon]
MKVNFFRRSQAHLDQLFQEAAELIEQASHYIHLMIVAMVDSNQEGMNLAMDKLLEMEKDFDNKSDLIVERLYSREVMTFSRSDRLDLINKMDNVVDHIINNSRRAHSYSPTYIPPEVATSLKIIAQNAREIGMNVKEAVLNLFSNFAEAEHQIIQIRTLQRSARNILWTTIHDLFQQVEDPRDLLYFDRFLRDLRLTYDKISDLGTTIRSLIFKYRL